jgi:hypothetical protein
MEDYPRWFVLGDSLMWPLIGMGLTSVRQSPLSSADLSSLPELALLHHAGCLETAGEANRRGKHSAAVCLVRQSVEALTIFELGLQPKSFAEPLLSAWKSGKKSHGHLRQALETEVWQSYGGGLWDEPWSEFYGNLARAVQPYAHYTAELQGWQFVTLDYEGGTEFTATYGLETYDAVLATRVTLLQMILTWMLGRLLLIQGGNPDVVTHREQIEELRDALASSKLLFNRGDWSVQLAPHILFKPGHSWRDAT